VNPELVPGQVAALADGVRRIIAPNPSIMTGPGTNTYLVGQRSVAVIDPGPLIEDHLRLIADSADVRWILATHTHPDHSPGAMRLAELTGATVIGRRAPEGPQQDQGFRPQHEPRHEERLHGDGFELLCLHTPGHASNHFCYLLDANQWLFTGDHVMGGSTVVINPPDGDMSAYLQSLRDLRRRRIEAIAPGHGEVLRDPEAVIDWLIEHRLARESLVRDAVQRRPGLTPEQLVTEVYTDVDASLYRLAERSLLAHLLKLQKDGAAIRKDGTWWPVEA